MTTSGEKGAAGPHVMLFDLYSGGHHPQYLYNITEYWVDAGIEGRLSLVVARSFLERHRWLTHYVRDRADAGVSLVAAGDTDPAFDTGSLAGLVRADRTHGKILKQCISRLQPDHATIMYVDHCQLSLMSDLRFDRSVGLSGIYFRPSFHYAAEDRGSKGIPFRLNRLRKLAMLRGALRNRHLTHLFCLDPYVVPIINNWSTQVEAVHLPDGVRIARAKPDRRRMHDQWDVEEGRTVALLFGSLSNRKGLHQVVSAIPALPADVQSKLHLVLAGPVSDDDRDQLNASVVKVRAETRVHVTLDDRYVPESEAQDVVAAADVVLLLYQREHVGSSNVLIRAAAAAVPVLGTSLGLLGRLIEHHHLGSITDASDSDAIAMRLASHVQRPESVPFDRPSAESFARSHSAERMGAVLFDHILRRTTRREKSTIDQQ